MDKLEQTLLECGEPVDLDFEYDDSTISIYNFNVPDDQQGQDIGPQVMTQILEAARAHGRTTIKAHIDLTHRGTDGYPADKDITNDPTLKFLRSLDFTIIDYGPDRTVLARKRL